jgi:membrane-associated phospholipid phosphatase
MWVSLSNIGDAALTLPVALTFAIWLAASGTRLAMRWLLLLAAGMALVGFTKILYAGCGVEIPSLDFRVISGHTMLATTVWTVVFAALWRSRWTGVAPGAAFGAAIGALTGVARIFEQAHSASEALAGWIVGCVVAGMFLREFVRAKVTPSRPVIAGVALLLVSGLAYGHHAPFQRLIEAHSPQLCQAVSSTLSGAFR